MKLTRAKAQTIAKQFITEQLTNESWFQQCKPHVKAILLYGSVAKGMNRTDSDIDILIFMPLKIEERYTDGEYFYSYNRHEINVVIRSIEQLRKIAEEHNDTFQMEVFREAVILEEVDNEVEKLLAAIRTIPG